MTTGVGSAERILALLGLFTEERLEWTADDMMAAINYSRPTLYRYLKFLNDAGFLTQHSGHRYTLGPRVVEMDFLMRKSDVLMREGRPILEGLAKVHPSTALLVRWYGNKLLCVDAEVSASNAKSSYPRGRPMPLARGAISRAILANLPRKQMLEKIRENFADLQAVGLGSSVEEIAETFKAQRKAGVFTARGEVTPGVIGVAAPVYDGGAVPVAVLCMTIDRDTLDDARLTLVRDAVIRAAGALTETLTENRLDAE
ncbi:MAG TPA: IclR family transcriptional regulator [Rhodobacteraceae bacterium]|jgi:DNA-binding IclR family transcriptional regulator|nr:IclR family transcriptional regulator [Paracoccaceae bacterium]HBV56455.1 IclR family transcriptional regulator [Paracoccaceae bacterium]